MAHTYLICDFGSNEEAAQQARHKVERWRQGFRLGDKLLVKFDRGDEESSGSKTSAKAAGKKATGTEKQSLMVMVRLDFSEHEKLSHQRWLERIPAEALFRDAHPKIVRQGDPDFAGAAERFDALD